MLAQRVARRQRATESASSLSNIKNHIDMNININNIHINIKININNIHIIFNININNTMNIAFGTAARSQRFVGPAA